VKTSAKPWLQATKILLLIFCLSAFAGCRRRLPRVEYLKGDAKVIFLNKGDKAPNDLYGISPSYMGEIYDKLEMDIELPE